MSLLGRLRRSPVSASLLGAMAVLSTIVIAAPSMEPLFVLVPGLVLTGPSMLSNLLTSALVETSAPKLALCAVSFAVCAPVGERAQGTARFALFLGASVIAASLGASLVEVMTFLFSRDDGALFTGMHGTAGLVAAAAVSAHQAAPDLVLASSPSLMPSAAFRARRAPFAAAAVLGAAAAIGAGRDGLTLAGSLLAAWSYLRFFQPAAAANHGPAPGPSGSPGAAGRAGDGRDHMAFVAMLPQPFRGLLSPPVAVAGVLCRPCVPVALGEGNTLPGEDGGPGAAAYAPMAPASRAASRPAAVLGEDDGLGAGGGLDPVAERRRAKARKALDARLAELERRRLQRGPSVTAARQLASAPEPAAGPSAAAAPAAPAAAAGPPPAAGTRTTTDQAEP